MSIATRMTMRASIVRRLATERDPYGGAVPADVRQTHSLPCYLQPRRESTLSGDGKIIAAEVFTMWAPQHADLANEDLVLDITDRAGRVLFPGRHRVVSLVRRETHLELLLERYT